MKLSIAFLALLSSIISFCQKSSVFKNVDFDSTFSIVGMPISFLETKKEDVNNDFCFYFNKVDDLNELKKDWIVKNVRPNISLEEYTITLYVIKGKLIYDNQLIIFPKQGIIHYANRWYDFDMKKFSQTIKDHALKYHSQYFAFDTWLNYFRFRDSVMQTPNYLFIIEPSKNKFEGYFDIISSRTLDPNSPIFVLHDINEELKAKFDSDEFHASEMTDDSFNIANKTKVKIRVECSKAVYEKYKAKFREKGEWTTYPIDARVFFKD